MCVNFVHATNAANRYTMPPARECVVVVVVYFSFQTVVVVHLLSVGGEVVVCLVTSHAAA